MSAKEIGGGVPPNAIPAGPPEFDVGFASDTSPWTPYQKLVLLLCSLVIVLDGFDALALGFAAPAMLPDLNLTKEELAPVLAIGLIGMTIGATIGGIIGDKFGRKIALLASTIIFGSMTGAIAFANDLPTLGLFRFIAGIGLGGALPNVTALVAEYTPQHRRSFAVTLSLVCMAVGGVVGGFVAAGISTISGDPAGTVERIAPDLRKDAVRRAVGRRVCRSRRIGCQQAIGGNPSPPSLLA